MAVNGSFGGSIEFPSKAYTGKMSIGAAGDITGKAGAFVTAKFAIFSLTKKFTLAEKVIAEFDWKKADVAISNGPADLWPRIEHIKPKDFGGKNDKSTSGRYIKVKQKGKWVQYQELTDD